MNDGQMFELSEDHAFTGRKTLGLKQNHIKFRGFNGDVSPIVVRNDQIEQFKEVLDFLDVWDWKPNYDPEDSGSLVLDGKSWSFTASLMNSEMKMLRFHVRTKGSTWNPLAAIMTESYGVRCLDNKVLDRIVPSSRVCQSPQ